VGEPGTGEEHPRGTSWSDFHRRWTTLQPPLRPHEDVCAAVRSLLQGHDSSVLLLGATPELAQIPARTIAVERSSQSLEFIWPGNRPARWAVRANWLALPCAAGTFSAAIGDGSLNCLEYPTQYAQLLHELVRVVRAGGRVILRAYVRPDEVESLDVIRARVLGQRAGGPHALKWMIAHAVCAERGTPNVPVSAILDAFDRLFPDRDALRHATGWSTDAIDQIDAYAGSADVFSFPTREELLKSVAADGVRARLLPAGDYDLADRCPLLVLDVA
jgi:hypothetical protein